jgi:3-dehydroquinate dehydratase-2
MRILVVNGPNLNLLGRRRPEVYGHDTLADLEARCGEWGTELGVEVETFQSNHEGAIVDRLHAAMDEFDGIVINPGALTHTSYVLHDAIEAIGIPTVEVHLSDITAREPWRAVSVIAPVCASTISGCGADGYRAALEFLAGLSR